MIEILAAFIVGILIGAAVHAAAYRSDYDKYNQAHTKNNTTKEDSLF
jgi:hypothetical protein